MILSSLTKAAFMREGGLYRLSGKQRLLRWISRMVYMTGLIWSTNLREHVFFLTADAFTKILLQHGGQDERYSRKFREKYG